MLMNFLFKRPDWFKHEGYWRLTQVLRLGPTLTFIIFSLLFLAVAIFLAVEGRNKENSGFAFAMWWFLGAVAYIVAMHWLVRLTVWVTDGFKDHAE